MLARGFWLGADAVLPFHTQLAVTQWEGEPEDLRFAQRLRDLAPLIGLDPLDHLFVTSAEVPVRLGAADGLEEPVALEEMESWTRTVPARKRPRYRHPHGHTWAVTFSTTDALRGRRGAWPRVPPLAEPRWAPFRRPNQASVVFRHPLDGQLWRGRGPKPRWLRQLLEEGFEEEEFKEYL